MTSKCPPPPPPWARKREVPCSELHLTEDDPEARSRTFFCQDSWDWVSSELAPQVCPKEELRRFKKLLVVAAREKVYGIPCKRILWRGQLPKTFSRQTPRSSSSRIWWRQGSQRICRSRSCCRMTHPPPWCLTRKPQPYQKDPTHQELLQLPRPLPAQSHFLSWQ